MARIGAPTLVMVGDDDLVSLEHSIALYRAIPGSELAVVPGTSHVLPLEKPTEVNHLVIEHFTGEPIEAMLPVRRATTRTER
ncbi:alpha/beta fold hydrolase [Streptomyces sp. NPDC057382]|uniref:alpha/beta fold hydrolase n=1 Tax=unclassified Streptomyces TaxID=2593676 RepID=UPI00362E1D7C